MFVEEDAQCQSSKVQFEIQALKLIIEGEREDIPLIRDAITDQVRGLLTPAATIVEGEKHEENGAKDTATPALPAPAPRRKRVTKVRAAAADEEGRVIEFNYDPAVHGQPLLKWTGAQKAIWLIYVIRQATGQQEFTGPEIMATFNTRFKDARPFKKTSNIYRDVPKQMWDGQPVVTEHEGKFILTQAAEGYFRNLPKPAAD